VKILCLETTCDETAAAVIQDDLTVLGAAVASQDPLHGPFAGVVPEIAARAHVERILPIIHQALTMARIAVKDLDGVAVATTPGLAGSLLVGLSAAKALAVALRIPLIAVDHLQAHIYACRLAEGPDVFPCVGLIASGGHTSLYRCQDALDFTLLGGTRDDAAGEAFDKVANLLGLPYPGGPAIQAAAAQGNRQAFKFPRSMLAEAERLEFSFSGLKTAVRYAVRDVVGEADKGSWPIGLVADVAASFQEAVVDVLAAKAYQALERCRLKTLCVGGGVACNARLREKLHEMAAERAFRLVIAPQALCTDNAVMGAIAFERLKAGQVADLDLDIQPGLVR